MRSLVKESILILTIVVNLLLKRLDPGWNTQNPGIEEMNYINPHTPSNPFDLIRLFIVGEQASIRQGLRMRLNAESDLRVSGEAFNSKAAVYLTQKLCPDIVLIDMDAENMDGLATARAIRTNCPNTAIILISLYDQAFTYDWPGDRQTIAFISKAMPTDILLATIRKLAYLIYGNTKGGFIQ